MRTQARNHDPEPGEMEKTYGSGEMQLSMIREEWGNDKGGEKRCKHELVSLFVTTNERL
jgi:hypothetical protein